MFLRQSAPDVEPITFLEELGAMKIFKTLVITSFLILLNCSKVNSSWEEFKNDMTKIQPSNAVSQMTISVEIKDKLDKILSQIKDINEQQTFPNNNQIVVDMMNYHLEKCLKFCRWHRPLKFVINKQAIVSCECAK